MAPTDRSEIPTPQSTAASRSPRPVERSAPRGRLLVVEPDAEGAVSGATGVPGTIAQLGRAARAEGARASGRLVADDLAHLRELVRSLRDLVGSGDAAAAATVEALSARAQRLDERLTAIASGRVPTDTLEVLHAVVAESDGLGDALGAVRLVLPPVAPAGAVCLVDPAEVADILFRSVRLVARAVRGLGEVRVEIETGENGVEHRLIGHGSSVGGAGPDAEALADAAEIRRLAQERNGGSVRSVAPGPGIWGLLLLLPSA
jgi:hypothetical protein